MKILLVAGTFDNDAGKPSGYMRKLYDALSLHHHDTLMFVNGGNFTTLVNLLPIIKSFDVIFWFCDVDNGEVKLVEDIKKIHPKCILVTSKNNLEGKYSFPLLIAHALKIKSNLFLELSRKEVGLVKYFAGSIADPLGNMFIEKSTDVTEVAKILYTRVKQLIGIKRVGSCQIVGYPPIPVPDQNRFFELSRKHAEKFHHLIHAQNQERFLGNLSFRCENGFPSFREDRDSGVIFVSRRNVDKTAITKDNFVVVDPYKGRGGNETLRFDTDYVYHFGKDKPSVDTPIQVRLYQFYKNINYMLHSHVYIKDAPFTSRVLPCGAIEEVDEIKELFADPEATEISINLKGHGSIRMVKDLEDLEKVDYYPRPLPEMQNV